MENIIGLKNLRKNMAEYIEQKLDLLTNQAICNTIVLLNNKNFL